jgi:hypothetical protein
MSHCIELLQKYNKTLTEYYYQLKCIDNNNVQGDIRERCYPYHIEKDIHGRTYKVYDSDVIANYERGLFTEEIIKLKYKIQIAEIIQERCKITNT